jgi:hypothetical protein
VATFDNGKPRSQVDWNNQGAFAGNAANFALAFNDAGTLLYGFNSYLSTADLKRSAVSPNGLQWLSSVGGLIGAYGSEIRQAGGLLYTPDGSVVDPERSRLVGKFQWLNPDFNQITHVVPDVAAGRLYATGTNNGPSVGIFDLYTHAFLGSIALPVNTSNFRVSGRGSAATMASSTPSTSRAGRRSRP